MFVAQILIECVDKEDLSRELNFIKFEYISKKLWHHILLFFVNGQNK